VYVEAGYVAEHFDTYIQAADLALIRQMGFDHVRFPIACEPMIDAVGGLRHDYITRLQQEIRRILDHDLAVMVDIHPDTPFKEALSQNDKALESFVSFWSAFAGHLSGFDPERVFFEVLNEPCIGNAHRWNELQQRCAAAIRGVAPNHTIIVAGDAWSQLDELLQMKLPEDDNLIANFHLYDPIAFTHQGASWSPPWAMETKGLTYPVNCVFVEAFLEQVDDCDAREQLEEYSNAGWNAEAYRQFIQPAVDWARDHQVPLTCNEFGVYKAFSPRQSRLAWIRDVSGVLEEAGVGWTMWDYAGSFAVVLEGGSKNKNGDRVPDRELQDSLRIGK
jgi:hypothetical protein